MKKTTMTKCAKKVLLQEIRSQHTAEASKLLLEKTNEIYVRFVNETPDIGGDKNPLSEQLYSSIALFAYYEATSHTVSPEKIGNLCVEMLIGNNRTLGKWFDFNWKWFQKINQMMYVILKKITDPHIADGSWHNTWKIELNPEGWQDGVNVHLVGCPVCDFAASHGYMHLMPYLCDADHKVFAPFHCRLVRKHTVASGDSYCDFWMLGDRSPYFSTMEK